MSHYDEYGRHICDCGAPTTYQSFSGGREFYCPSCENNGLYPEGDGGPRARLLAQPNGAVALRAQMDQELARRRDNPT